MKFLQRKNISNNLFTELVSGIFILLFTYTAVSKLMDLSSFESVLASSPLTKKFAGVIAWALPASELIISALLFFPATKLPGLKSSFALMILFTLYLGYMLAFAPSLPCSCGGIIQELSWQQHLWFNLALTVLALAAILFSKNNKLFIAINRRSRKPV